MRIGHAPLVSLPLAWFANGHAAMRAEEAAIAGLGAKQVDWIRPTPRWLQASKKPGFDQTLFM